MKSDTRDASPAAATFEFRRPMRLSQCSKFREERSRFRQGPQQSRHFIIKADHRNGLGLLAAETHNPVRSISVFGGRRGHVGLRRANVPAKLVERVAFRVSFHSDDFPMLFFRNAPLFAVFDLGPASFGEDGPRQPIHVQSKIM
jgi:hypothetical protein